MKNGTFIERHLQLQFDDAWHVEKYDGHPNCRQIQKLDGTKAVDFVATQTLPRKVLYFIEVKDFRTFPTELRKELKSGSLVAEIAQKLRDTLPGMIGAWRNPSSQHAWQPFAAGLFDLQTEIHIIVWLESDSPSPVEAPVAMSTLTEELKKKLCWLTTKVTVLSLKQGRCPDGLEVVSLPFNDSSDG